jgi:hypothetical protein
VHSHFPAQLSSRFRRIIFPCSFRMCRFRDRHLVGAVVCKWLAAGPVAAASSTWLVSSSTGPRYFPEAQSGEGTRHRRAKLTASAPHLRIAAPRHVLITDGRKPTTNTGHGCKWILRRTNNKRLGVAVGPLARLTWCWALSPQWARLVRNRTSFGLHTLAPTFKVARVRSFFFGGQKGLMCFFPVITRESGFTILRCCRYICEADLDVRRLQRTSSGCRNCLHMQTAYKYSPRK